MFGFLNINKPAGLSSYDVIRRLKRVIPKGEKIGHAGTLDPFATGVLVVALGHACRLIEHVQAQAKEYRALVRLGAISDTDDSDGVITATLGCVPPSRQAVQKVLESMTGTIQQTPPAHSAVHVEGQRAYKLARQGQAVELSPRPVTIHAIKVLSYDWPALELDITCGSGTYIRSIARDAGKALGVGGYCQGLTRTRVGHFALEQARQVEDVHLPEDLISPLAAVQDLPKFVADQSQTKALSYGQSIAARPMPVESGPVAIVDQAGSLLAMAEADGDKHVLRPTAVFVAK